MRDTATQSAVRILAALLDTRTREHRATLANHPDHCTTEAVRYTARRQEVARLALDTLTRAIAEAEAQPLPIHRTEAGYPNCSTCDGGGCPDCTDSAYDY